MQDELIKIFSRLKKLLKQYEKPLMPKFDLDSKYDLWSYKDMVTDGRKRSEIYFAGLIIQSSYVGFYYMPVYTDTNLKNDIKPDLLKLIKGKSCFHIRNLDENLKIQIKDALETGYRLCQERGWI